MAEDHVPSVFLNINDGGRGMLVVDGVDLSSIARVKQVTGPPNGQGPAQIELVLWVANGWISLNGKQLYDTNRLDPRPLPG